MTTRFFLRKKVLKNDGKRVSSSRQRARWQRGYMGGFFFFFSFLVLFSFLLFLTRSGDVKISYRHHGMALQRVDFSRVYALC
ncbi:MAG: hypothetical protein J5545_01645 [Bacteroidaceae bacterium]|nr:hypothetical protein [Bacteroidaceae bacterium]